MRRLPQPPARLTTAAAIWRSDSTYCIGLMIVVVMLMVLLALRAR